MGAYKNDKLTTCEFVLDEPVGGAMAFADMPFKDQMELKRVTVTAWLKGE